MQSAQNFAIDENGNPVPCCANCFAYRPNPHIPDNKGGDCRMNPPTVIVVKTETADARGRFGDRIQTLFPPVPAHEFCWKFAIHPALKQVMDVALSAETGKKN